MASNIEPIVTNVLAIGLVGAAAIVHVWQAVTGTAGDTTFLDQSALLIIGVVFGTARGRAQATTATAADITTPPPGL